LIVVVYNLFVTVISNGDEVVYSLDPSDTKQIIFNKELRCQSFGGAPVTV